MDPILSLQAAAPYWVDNFSDPGLMDISFDGKKLNPEWMTILGQADLDKTSGWLQMVTPPGGVTWIKRNTYRWPLSKNFQVETCVRSNDKADSRFIGMVCNIYHESGAQAWFVTGIYQDSAQPELNGIHSRAMEKSAWKHTIKRPASVSANDPVYIVYQFQSEQKKIRIGVKFDKAGPYEFYPGAIDLYFVPDESLVYMGTWNDSRDFLYHGDGKPSDDNIGEWDYFKFSKN